MDQQADTRSRTGLRSRVRDEFTGPPRPSGYAVYALLIFGLLLSATLTIDGFTGVSPMPGTALVMAGMMLLTGVAELMDPAARRVVIGVRFGGMAMALLGIAVQLFG